ncbi:hypothetical protein LPJ53_005996 [Coemansia erecta]|uniref:Tubulin-specific chaperone A n=1 Tax=Coemansia erecta TaxID=147472 RepID=A0A9W7XUF0_9FUNG|nr:hypothetical protein LPJ53_005996 [Coemansia erecta]
MSSASNLNNTALVRTLKIKTNAVKRLVKDRSAYLSEVTAQQQRIETLRAKDGVHEADIRKQNEVLEETVQMIPHTERRIKDSLNDLENLVLSVQSELGSTPEFADAKAAIDEAKGAVPVATNKQHTF